MISVVILTKNEEKNIVDCVKSVSWCDEILVVDDNSEDKTRELAKKFGAKVIERSLAGNFANQRNFALEKASGEWIFFVDADERVTPSLRDEIIQYTNNPINKFQGIFIHRRDYMWGRQLNHGENGSYKVLRIAKKGAGKWRRKVHETWHITGPTKILTSPLLHYPHPTIAAFLKEINFYSTIRAEELHTQKVKVHWWDIILYPKAKFVQDYFFKLGLLDGTAGFLSAIMMSFHSFLVRGKVWTLQQKNN